MGNYRVIWATLPPARAFVLDEADHVFEIMNDCSLREVGFLRGRSQTWRASRWAALAFHPVLERAVFLTESGIAITVTDFAGNRFWAQDGGVVAVLYASDGNSVWTCEKIDPKQLRLALYHAESGGLIAERPFADELYDSSVSLMNLPQGNSVLMELAAGQDGVMVFLLTFDGGIQARKLFPGHSHILPAFHPNLDRLLVLENDENLYYAYAWPELSLIAKQREYTKEEWVMEGNSELFPGYHMIYLQNDLAVTQSANYRFYLFDPVRMERIEELVIEGFEPVPTREVYPRLDDDTLFSTVLCFHRHGDFLVAATLKEAKTRALIVFKEEELLKQLGRRVGI
ncbi:MAG: hypothetical protein LBD04_00810 [Synergistaceae bacterium]|nr:hypothetical protein [Synergistaceae bacterium]